MSTIKTVETMPVLFIGHGSPMNIILNNDYTNSLVKAAKEIPTPRAILVISAHWLTNGTYVTCVNKPRRSTISMVFQTNSIALATRVQDHQKMRG